MSRRIPEPCPICEARYSGLLYQPSSLYLHTRHMHLPYACGQRRCWCGAGFREVQGDWWTGFVDWRRHIEAEGGLIAHWLAYHLGA